MSLSGHRRRGTAPSFWRAYHDAQFKVAACSMRAAPSGIVREPCIQEIISEFEKTKQPKASQFVNVMR